MAVVTPVFPTTLPADLAGDAAPWAVDRAVLDLPYLLRMNCLRAGFFAGSYAVVETPALREVSADAFRNALTAYDAAADALFAPERALAHRPAAVALIRAATGASPAAGRAATAMRAAFATVEARMPDGTVPVADFERMLEVGYGPFTTDVLHLEEEMKARCEANRAEAQDRALAAQRDADTACADLRRIARTVGIISINAGVEAARAGEDGRAFSVIAKEIKGLSERAQDATGRIGGAVEAMMSRLRAN